MANWAKKINKAVKSDLEAGEEVRDGVFVQPLGSTSDIVAKEVAGMLGRALVKGPNGEDASEFGHASALPDDRLVLGLTDRRLVVWGHSQLSGRPKGFKMALPASDIVSVEVEKLKAVYSLVITFSDGSSKIYEAPRIANDPKGFAATVGTPVA